MTDVNTVWSRQRCFAENKIFIFDDVDHHFLSQVQARVASDPFVKEVEIVKGLPSGSMLDPEPVQRAKSVQLATCGF